MKKILSLVLLFTTIAQAQVGVGTTSPTAELEIGTSTNGIPALELNPQTAPVGSATGQIAMIGDQLYAYDATRGKWLSVAPTILSYGRTGTNRSNQVLRFVGNMNNQNTGALMPMNGTIVHASIRTSGGNTTKDFSIEVRNGTTVQSSTTVNLAAGEYINSNLNVDFSAGDYIISRIGATGAGVDNATMILWVKWRQ